MWSWQGTISTLLLTSVLEAKRSGDNEKCSSFGEGHVYPVGKPAPAFQGITAVINGEFKIKTPRAEGGLGPIRVPLLSDLTHQVSKDYGVYLSDAGHTLRGLFIIDGKGILRQITMNDLPVGRSVDETIRLVQAFQYTDTHGEVCPAGWKPGGDTIIPHPNQKTEYFKKHSGDGNVGEEPKEKKSNKDQKQGKADKDQKN